MCSSIRSACAWAFLGVWIGRLLAEFLSHSSSWLGIPALPLPWVQAGPGSETSGARFNLPLQLHDLGREETKDLNSKRPQLKPIRGHTVVMANYDGIIKDGITALGVLIEPLAIETLREREGTSGRSIYASLGLFISGWFFHSPSCSIWHNLPS